MTARRVAAGLALAALAALFIACAASPHREGHFCSEPQGNPNLTVTALKLTLDLQPLADLLPAQVAAVYELQNDRAAAVSLDLSVHVPTNGVIRLDGNDLPGDQGTWDGSSPQNLPTVTPSCDDNFPSPVPYRAKAAGYRLRRHVPVPPGPHTLTLSYPMTPTQTATEAPACFWQVGYDLGGAARWRRLGRLDVAVLLPRGWHARCQGLDLTREGDQLSGSFPAPQALPVLAVTTQAPYRKVPSTAEVAGWWLGGLVVGLMVCPLAGWAVGAVFARRGVGSSWGLLASALIGVALGVGLLLIVFQATGQSGVPDSQKSWAQSDNSPFASLGRALFGVAGLFASFLAGALGFGLAQLTFWNVYKHRRPRPDLYRRDDRDDTDLGYRPRDLG
jgi:hypothetical protein